MRISKSDAIRAGTDAVVPEAHMTTFRPPSHSSSASKSLGGNDDTGHGCIGKAGEAEEAKSKENDRQALAGRGNEGQAEELRCKEKLSEELKQNVAIPAAAEESKGPTSEKLGTYAKDGDASVSVSKPEQQDPLEVRKAYWKALLFRMGRNRQQCRPQICQTPLSVKTCMLMRRNFVSRHGMSFFLSLRRPNH
jgi:hypothetical protein